MALIKCKDCGRDVSTNAEKCPNCGAPAPKRAAANKSAARFALGCLAIIVVVVMGGTILGTNALLNGISGGSAEKTSATDYKASPSAGQNDAMIATLRGRQAQCRKSLRDLEATGDVKISDFSEGVKAEYDEIAWGALEHDDKIKAAMLIYCAKMPADGLLTLLIQGLHDGKSMASVVNGDYSDD